MQRCQALRGEELFKYLDDEGKRQTVQAEDVNAYLQDITGREITAKDFRTWAGTMLVAEALRNAQQTTIFVDCNAISPGTMKAVAEEQGLRPESRFPIAIE